MIDSQADIIRLTKPAKASAAIFRNGQWQAAGKVTIPAGWYAGPGPLD